MKGHLLVTLVIAAAFASSSAYANKLYRFNVDGRTVLKDHIPPEMMRYGYEVLGSNGMIIKVVAPPPTAAELSRLKAAERAKERRIAAQAEQKTIDLDLRRLYEKPKDVERARLRKSEEVHTYIRLQQRRASGLEQKLSEAQTRAASFERKGGEVPTDIRQEVAELQSALTDTERDIAERRKELSRITRDYAEQFERIRILQVYPVGTLYEDVDFERLERELAATAEQ